MWERLRIRAVDGSLLDSNLGVIPLMATISWMKSFAFSVSTKSGTVFSFSQVA